jgi:hypothetical protein
MTVRLDGDASDDDVVDSVTRERFQKADEIERALGEVAR